MRKIPIVLCLSALVASAQAQIVVGPNDDLQLALDAAPAGAVIEVSGAHRPIVIVRPVTLVGGAQARITTDLAVYGGADPDPWLQPVCVTLAGPGSGTVTLASISIGESFDGYNYYNNYTEAFTGTGFERLELHGCQVDGTGVNHRGDRGVGASAIEVSDIPFVLLSRSVVSAGLTQDVGRDGPHLDARPGVVVRRGLLSLNHSIVRGGNCEIFYSASLVPYPLPAGGSGGDAVDADVLLESHATLTPGYGLADDPLTTVAFPSGHPASARTIRYPNGWQLDSQPMQSGSPTTIHSPFSAFAALGRPTTPLDITIALPGSRPLCVAPITTVVVPFTFVPPLAAFGETIGLQAFDLATLGLTAPIFERIR